MEVKKKENILPKVLSISLSTWRKDSGIHTQTDLFKFWNPDRVAQIYTRADMPNTPVCNNFFQISENEIIKSIFRRNNIGKRVFNTTEVDNKTQKAINAEKKLYAFAHKRKSWFMTIIREIVWNMGCWKSNALDHFIEEEAPDVYFIPIYPVVYMGKLQLYILKKYPKPYVCYLTDDNYSYKACGKNIFAYIHRFMLRKVVKKLAINCTEMFTITKTQAEETDRLFGTHSIVLTKGINYKNLDFEKKILSKPIKMVYTGNLFIGRANSLMEISKALSKINKVEKKIILDIYSPTIVDKKIMKYLNSNGCNFKGSVTKEEIDKIQKSADIVVFVESLEKKHRFDARLSFSTKLTDYFKNGKCIFAIGDKSIAPIIYLKENNCAIVVNEYEEIEGQLKYLIQNPEKIVEYGRNAFECGRKNHNETDVRKIFIETFYKAVNYDTK